MRVTRNGAICDFCGKSIPPFKLVKIKSHKLVKGRKYPYVTSDTKEKVAKLLDLCSSCYNEFILDVIERRQNSE